MGQDTDKRLINGFNDKHLDHWQMRKLLQEVHFGEYTPTFDVASSILLACRRLNDIALAIRFLEAVKVI